MLCCFKGFIWILGNFSDFSSMFGNSLEQGGPPEPPCATTSPVSSVIDRHNRLTTAIRAELKLWRLPVLTVRNRVYTPVVNLFTDLIQQIFGFSCWLERKSKKGSNHVYSKHAVPYEERTIQKQIWTPIGRKPECGQSQFYCYLNASTTFLQGTLWGKKQSLPLFIVG